MNKKELSQPVFQWRLRDQTPKPFKYGKRNVSTRVSMEVEGSLCKTNVYMKRNQIYQRTNVLNQNVYRRFMSILSQK